MKNNEEPDCQVVVKITPKFSNGIMIRSISEILGVFKSKDKCREFAEKTHLNHLDWGIDVYDWWFDD